MSGDIESLYAAFRDMADELDREAAVISPSKAAEIKRDVAGRIRAALGYWEESL